MNTEKELFWIDLKTRLCPPPGMYYTIHTTTMQHASEFGLPFNTLEQRITAEGLFVPSNYSVLTLQLSIDWVRPGKMSDFIFYTYTKPTEEPNVDRDCASLGFPLRDPILNTDSSFVPSFIRRKFPKCNNFVVAPAHDLRALISWPKNGMRFEIIQFIKS